MTEVVLSEARSAIHGLLSRLNYAWMHKRGQEMTDILHGCFEEDVVMRVPGFVLLGSGRDFAVQSYCDFVTQAEIKNFSSEQTEIDVIGDTATAGYQWTMNYVLAGQEYKEHGRDLFVLSQRGGQWAVVWRALLA